MSWSEADEEHFREPFIWTAKPFPNLETPDRTRAAPKIGWFPQNVKTISQSMRFCIYPCLSKRAVFSRPGLAVSKMFYFLA